MFQMGANIIDRKKSKISFTVFAYDKKGVNLLVKTGKEKKVYPMEELKPHIYVTTIEGLGPDLLYKFQIKDEGEFPDPYSHFQPQGVHGFSQVIDHSRYNWQDSQWPGKNLEELVIMEIHVGTFTPKGTFQAAVDKLDYLVDLGINAVELMPLTQTPGRWNWGYDGTNLFSVNHNYGSPDDLKYFIDCCHSKNLAVILDIVFNHFGPEGNYLPVFGPYFTRKHETPWGPAVNFDDDLCQYTRQMVLDSVQHWLKNYHFDGLRLDAVHAIKDSSTPHILEEISRTAGETAEKLGRKIHVIAESDENDVRLITPPEKGGYGMDAQWMDDFHHVVHTALTGEREGYYVDYGNIEDFRKVFKNFLYSGQYSRYWKKERGTDASSYPGKQFVVCIQNHDQVGNRALGERLSLLVDFSYLKVAAGLLFFSPYVPLLFMGEEYGEKNPFLFFTDYQDPELQEAVSRGRKKEFSAFTWENVPDPQADETFYRSKLTPKEKWQEENKLLYNFYKDLIALKTSHPVLKKPDKNNLEVEVDSRYKIVKVVRRNDEKKLTGLFNLGSSRYPVKDMQSHRVILDSESKRYSLNENFNKDILRGGQMMVFESQI